MGMLKTNLVDNPYEHNDRDDDDDDDDDDYGKKKKGIKKGYVGDDSDEDEKDDREYSWKIYRK